MLKALREFFDQQLAPAAKDEATEIRRLQLATAALLIELSRADFHEDEREREKLVNLLQNEFELSKKTILELVDLAEQELGDATCLFDLCRMVDREYPVQRKQRVLEMMWELAYADGRLDKYEEYLIRKLADLLHIPHSGYIGAKLRVQGRLERENQG